MAECIICRLEKNKFNDEHVIPDALGGYYHIKTVCTDCNSKLGTNVDSKLVNHAFSKFQRYLLNLKGKASKAPNPFAGDHELEGMEGEKVQLRDDSGRLIPYIIPSVKYTQKAAGEETLVQITLDSSDEKQIDTILAKISKKYKVPVDELKRRQNRTNHSIPSPSIQAKLAIDIKDFKIGLLKIAYEFAIDSLPDYYSDPNAIQLARVLESADYDLAAKHVNLGDGFNHEIFEAFTQLIDLQSKKHYLVITVLPGQGLVCLIHLHGMFSIGVSLSSLPYDEDTLIIGVNDIDGKSFKKFTGDEVAKSLYLPPELRFQYYFETEAAVDEFFALEQQPEFGFYSQNGDYPLFDRHGTYLHSTLFQKMNGLDGEVITTGLSGGGVAHVYPFTDEVYIKLIPSGKLVRIVAVQEEQRQVGRL